MFLPIWLMSGAAALCVAYSIAKESKTGIKCSDFGDLLILIGVLAAVFILGTLSLGILAVIKIGLCFEKHFDERKPFVVVKGKNARV